LLLALALAAQARGQAIVTALFASNNGNLEGSLTAYTVNPDGTLAFVNRVVTGSRPSTSVPCSGCNSYELSLTPNGRYIATVHPAGDADGLTFYEVAANAAVSQVLHVPLEANHDGPLDVEWLDNQYVAVAVTQSSPDVIDVYRFNPAVPSATRVNTVDAGTNGMGYFARHPTLPVLYANDSSTKVVRAYRYDTAGNLALIDTELSGLPFPLEITVSANGAWLYAGCGISDSGNKIVGMSIDGTGALTLMAGSPFISPTTSTFNVYTTGDSGHLVVGHSTSGQVHTFSLDGLTGVPTATGNFFDVGLQGEGQDVRTIGNTLFVVDNFNGATGVYSFTVGPGGTLAQNGVLLSTQGIAPRSLATWVPCPATGDLNCDCAVDLDDIDPFALALLDPAAYAAAYPACNIAQADLNGDTFADAVDLALLADLLVP
jgi:6-phosphogluconolactonase (cycloisomerase 2 family)